MPSAESSMETVSSDLFDVLKSVDIQISNPGLFCSASSEKAATLSELMRSLFKTSADSSTKTFGPFQELLVDGFDGETIWEELQTRNRPLTRFVKKKIVAISKSITTSRKAKAHALKDAVKEVNEFAMGKDEIGTEDEKDLISENEDEEESEGLEENDEEEEEEEEGGDFDEDEDIEDGDNAIDLNMDSDDAEEDEEEYEGGGDASYDNIDDMQAWLDKEEELEERHEKKLARLEKLAAQKGAVEEGPDSDDEEDDMLFVEREMYDDHESDGDDDDDTSNKKKKKKGSRDMKGSEIKYEDFFRGDISQTKSESASSSESAKSSSGNKSKGSVKKHIVEDDGGDDEDDLDEEEEDGEGEGNEDEDEDDSERDFDENGGDDYDFDDDDDEEVENGKASKTPVRTRALTTHEKRELKMAAQIKEIEGQLIAVKPWDMRGEIKSLERPENSLLEITAQVERASKSAPMATEEFTSSLEDMIIKRIREELFDDVVLKETVDDIIGLEEREDLSQEKSRVGLGEIYAEDFLAAATSSNSGAKEAKETAVRDQLKELYHKVCRQLDGLSHFHYTPKPVVSESRIFGTGPEAALPSLSLEDIIPTTENSSTVLAPEEIKDRKRGRAAALVADEELSKDDKRRLRRASKATNKKSNKSKDEEEKRSAENDITSKGNKARRKQEDKKTDNVLRSDHRVIEGIEENGSSDSSYAKSAVFFSNLQRTAQEAIGGVKNTKKSKKRGYDPNSSDHTGVQKKASGFKL